MNLMLTIAANALLPTNAPQSFTLYVPPGLYTFNDPATVGATFNFLTKASTVSIVGEPGASIFQLNLGALGSLGAFANMLKFEMRGMTFYGLQNDGGATPDCDAILQIVAQYEVVFEDCLWINIAARTYGMYTSGRTIYRACHAYNVAGKNAAFGFFHGASCTGFLFDDSYIVDIGNLNARNNTTNKSAVNTTWIHVVGECEYVGIINSFLDESCDLNIKVDGDTARVKLFEIRGCLINPPAHIGTAVAQFQAIKVDHVLVDGLRNQQTGSICPLYDLQSVHLTTIIAHELRAGVYFSPVLQADASCGVIRLIVSPDITGTPSQITSSAVMTYSEDADGVVRRLFVSGGAINANDLVQLTAVGTVSQAPAGAAANTIYGVAQQTVGGAAAKLWVALMHQYGVTVHADGAGPIAVGDRLAPSAVTAGRVVTAAGGALGLAETAAAANGTVTMLAQ